MLNAGFEATGVNAAASAGDAIGRGEILEGSGGALLAVAPFGTGGRGVAGVLRGYRGGKNPGHALHQAI